VPEYVEVNYDDCIGETEKAFKLVVEGEEVWVPKSVIDAEEQVPEVDDEGGEFGACFVATWWLREKGLI
jgi:hypothetical protein